MGFNSNSVKGLVVYIEAWTATRFLIKITSTAIGEELYLNKPFTIVFIQVLL